MPKTSKPVTKLVKMELIDEPRGIIRLEIDPTEIQSLASNIQEVGLLQPIIIRPVSDRFEIIAGHRRFLAYQRLGRKEIECSIKPMSDVECALARASENGNRVNLSPIEEAASYADLHETYKLSYEEIGQRMGKSPGVVKRRLDLLKMPAQLQQAVHKGQICYGVAEELWRLKDIGAVDYYLGYAVDHGVTVAVARQWVLDYQKSQRHTDSDVGGGGGGANPLEPTPYYVSCDLCLGPVEVNTVKYIKSCPQCLAYVMGALRGAREQSGGQ